MPNRTILCPYLLGIMLALSPVSLPAQTTQSEEKRNSDESRNQEQGPGEVISAPVSPKDYVIGPEDVLMIRVWREPEISGAMAVRPDGKITVPLIGEVTAGGVTPYDLTQSLTDSLSKFINRPEVMVSVQEVRSKKYLISGQVARPGSFPLVVPTRVLEALVNAGGLSEWANKKKIIIMRGSERLFFNYKDVIKGKKLEQNILLEPGDHIIVE